MTFIKILVAVLIAHGAAQPLTPDNQPTEPFRIADNLCYVGSSDIASYSITSRDGHILIDAGYETPQSPVESSVDSRRADCYSTDDSALGSRLTTRLPSRDSVLTTHD